MKNKYIEINGKKFVKFSYAVRNRGKIIDYHDRGTYITTEPILVWIDYHNQNEYIIVPAGYTFDFGSVPRWGRVVAEKDEYVAFLAHDRLFDVDCQVIVMDPDNLSERFQKLRKYGYGYTDWTNSGMTEFRYDRKFADKLLYMLAEDECEEILRVDRPIQLFLIYLAVRLGGAKNFRKKIKN